MAAPSSESQNDLETLSKEEVEAMLEFVNEDILNAAPQNGSQPSSEVSSFSKMLQKYFRTILIDPYKFVNYNEFISPKFPFYELISKSKVLKDDELFEAVVCSKIFNDSSTFEENRETFSGKSVWLPMDCNGLVFLVFQDEIIYSMYKGTVNHIRENVSKLWETLKNMNLEVQDTPETSGEQSKLVFNFQPSSSAANFGEAGSISPTTEEVSYPMTNGFKKVLLDELNRITNLDFRIKEEFKQDMKSLPCKNLQYWYDRLEALRSYSYSSQKSQDFQKLLDVVTVLAKNVTDLTASVRGQLEGHLVVIQKLNETMIRFTDTLQKAC